MEPPDCRDVGPALWYDDPQRKGRAEARPLWNRGTKDQFAGNELRSTPPPTVPTEFEYVRVVPVCVSVTVTV